MIARRNELFKISGIRGKYPQLFIDDQFAGSFEECNDLNEGGEFREMLHWRLSSPPKPEAGSVIAAFYGAKYGGGGGVKVNMDQFKVSAERCGTKIRTSDNEYDGNVCEVCEVHGTGIRVHVRRCSTCRLV